MIKIAAVSAVLALIATPAAAQVTCKVWGPPQKVGTLDLAVLNNTSGLAASKAFPGRLYHHNDAQGGGKFYVSDAAGQSLRTITIAGLTPVDLEDIALGPCPGVAGGCLWLGDFGDNGVNRTSVSFTVLPEKGDYAATETALKTITARYPDGPHNAEGFAIHPNGDLILITKSGRTDPETRVYKLTKAQLAASDMQTFSEVGRIDLNALIPPAAPARAGAPPRTAVATALDLSPDGQTALILTYTGAVEIAYDLDKAWPPQAQWKAGKDYGAIATASLPQAEGVAYVGGKMNAFLYTSEYMSGGTESPIMKQTCAG